MIPCYDTVIFTAGYDGFPGNQSHNSTGSRKVRPCCLYIPGKRTIRYISLVFSRNTANSAGTGGYKNLPFRFSRIYASSVDTGNTASPVHISGYLHIGIGPADSAGIKTGDSACTAILCPHASFHCQRKGVITGGSTDLAKVFSRQTSCHPAAGYNPGYRTVHNFSFCGILPCNTAGIESLGCIRQFYLATDNRTGIHFCQISVISSPQSLSSHSTFIDTVINGHLVLRHTDDSAGIGIIDRISIAADIRGTLFIIGEYSLCQAGCIPAV